MRLKLDIDLNGLSSPFLIHSDIFCMSNFIRKRINQRIKKHQFLRFHLDFLSETFGIRDIAFPAFNYEFPKSKVFHLKNTQSQSGALTNYVLKNDCFVRTKTPIFSFLVGLNQPSEFSSHPFGSKSYFNYLYDNDGTIIFYGAKHNTATYLHFVESQFGPPRYRYDKCFKGSIINDESTIIPVEVEFHTRPLGLELEYDWDFLWQLLKQKNVVRDIAPNFFAVKAKYLSEIWGGQIINDDLSILSQKSKKKFKSILKKFNHRLKIEDFENE